MNSKQDRYEVCDFCHKPHKASELEKVVITYKKCKHCTTDKISLGESTRDVSSDKMPVNITSPLTSPVPIRKPQVPPYLASAFGAPDGFELGNKPPVEMPKTNFNKSKNETRTKSKNG